MSLDFGAMSSPPSPASRDHALAAVLIIAGLKLLLHLLTNGEYGFHRDELATLDDARYLDWGYVAYPPFTPFVGRVALTLFGPSLSGARFFPALAMSLCVVLAGLMARELGGARAAQVTAALAVAISPVVLGASALFQYVAFDFLWWVVIGYGLLRLANTDDPRWWLGVGAAIGFGVETKYTIGLCVLGVVAGVLIARPRDLRSKWLWAGVVLSVLIASPNFIWQAQHDFISVEFLKSIHARDVGLGRTAGFLTDQFKEAANPVTIPLWILGALTLVRSWRQGRERMLACYVGVPFVLFVVLKGRGYYAAPLYPVLLAAGAVAAEAATGRLGAVTRRRVRVFQWTLFAVGAAVAMIALPMAPVGSAWWRFALEQNDDLAEEVGWPELVQTIASVYSSLPVDERARTGIIASNYGEAGAVNLYGKALGLPEAISGVNSYWARGYGNPPPTTLIVLGSRRESLDRVFSSCEVAAHTPNPLNVRNEETERHPDIFVCRQMKVTWPELWPRIRSFG